MSKEAKYITIGNASYNIAVVSAMTLDAFTKESKEQAKDSKVPNLHFSGWDNQDAKLKEVWEAAKAKTTPPAPVKEKP